MDQFQNGQYPNDQSYPTPDPQNSEYPVPEYPVPDYPIPEYPAPEYPAPQYVTPEYPTYNYPTPPPQPQKSNTLCVAALIAGIAGFFINPLYIVSIAAVVLGIIGIANKSDGKTMAIAGICLGGVSLVSQFTLDLLLTIFSMGMGACTFCI